MMRTEKKKQKKKEEEDEEEKKRKAREMIISSSTHTKLSSLLSVLQVNIFFFFEKKKMDTISLQPASADSLAKEGTTKEQVDRSTSYPEVKTILKWRHKHPRSTRLTPTTC